MFTGLVEEMGVVLELTRRPQTAWLEVAAPGTSSGSAVGASVAVNGACLTVVAQGAKTLAFELGPETLERTALGRLAAEDAVNLERPLRLDGALGGHLVLGHVDGRGEVLAPAPDLRVRIPAELMRYVVEKGSITIDGVSLTVSALGDDWLEVSLIPTTLGLTTLGRAEVGTPVNLEVDVIAKYVERLLNSRDA